jgi:hypothetical protein
MEIYYYELITEIQFPLLSKLGIMKHILRVIQIAQHI